MIDIRQLRYFAQIVESGSLARASRQLSVVQPALSQQIAKLEEDIGRPLLVRSSRGVTPTQNGTALYHHAKFVLRQLDQAVAVARQDRAALTGCVSVGLAPTTNCQLGLPLLQHMRQRLPGVMVNVIEGMSIHLEQMAHAGELDLAILFRRKAAGELDFEPLLEEELFVILPADSPLVPPGAASLTLAQAARLPLIMPSTDHGLRRRIMAEFDHANVPFDAAAEVDSLPLLMRCLADGMGATIKPMAAIHSWREPEYWRVLPIADARMHRLNLLYSLPDEKLSPCAAAVRDELRLLVRELVASGRWDGVRVPGHEPCPGEPAQAEAADAG
ncbi:tricarballylate utilization LysR family transcriptional regulator TcuR [Pigmentiphaga soli]|uniref:Tricarballylate utilization LysR family transcriptional regulator TcuR n=1 Tax=Pigmentiphaga soli TaxID=1007095 RepID=A0ABP8GSN1_9BURK